MMIKAAYIVAQIIYYYIINLGNLSSFKVIKYATYTFVVYT